MSKDNREFLSDELTFEHILNSCCKAWNEFTSTVGAVRQLCTREWAKN